MLCLPRPQHRPPILPLFPRPRFHAQIPRARGLHDRNRRDLDHTGTTWAPNWACADHWHFSSDPDISSVRRCSRDTVGTASPPSDRKHAFSARSLGSPCIPGQLFSPQRASATRRNLPLQLHTLRSQDVYAGSMIVPCPRLKSPGTLLNRRDRPVWYHRVSSRSALVVYTRSAYAVYAWNKPTPNVWSGDSTSDKRCNSTKHSLLRAG
ncbi:hypothetical protein DAEQUDRAFT_347045 [Daedalea quercina L-15889]|uniref:Uncharacterized protein n=1 Tax=Daedalea quercina L-15889 TaxID=1314783 RepID=A0A165PCH5_9APHY|nr:hypothetical protein DAEQUDRAFT_347045 [Daedalea quercina L-15889]